MESFKTSEGGGKGYGSIVIKQEDKEEAAQSDVFEAEPLIEEDADESTNDENEYPPITEMWKNLTFGWFTPVLESIQQQLECHQSPNLETTSDIPPLPDDDATRPVSQQFQEAWKDELDEAKSESRDPQLSTVLWQCFRPLFLQAGCLKAIHDCLQFVGPQVLHGLIQFLRDADTPLSRGVYLTLAVTAAQLCMSLTLRHYFFKCYRVGLRIRTAILLAIYQKSLTIDTSYYQTHPIGQITNLMSVDVQRLQDVVNLLHAIWYSWLQIMLALYFLWQQLGPSCLAGVLVILASIPLTGITAQWMGRLQKHLMAAKDQRVQINQEILANMKIVKVQAWERPFLKKITKFRQIELNKMYMYMLGQAITGLMWSAVPLLIALCTFGAYVAIAGEVLDVASALTALALFEILRFPLYMLPMVINMLVEAGVSLKRIQDFLSAPNHIRPKCITNNNDKDSSSTKVVQIFDATFSHQNTTQTTKPTNTITKEEDMGLTEKNSLLAKTRMADAGDALAESEGRPAYKYGYERHHQHHFDESKTKLALRRVTLDSYQGEFLAVVGGVGCGKSTLLKALVGEVHTVSGEVGIDGTIAYFDQKPFLMNDTVKGNILFGKPDDNPELYELAIQSCSLEHDLSLLSHGDETEIGERGITLSGGQKARIAMARVVYHDADISLLDDCLSAVDAHVGRDLFDECIIKVLLQRNHDESPKKRTVILVTNALQYLSHSLVDRIVVLKNGAIVETGSYKELLSRENSQFRSSLRSFNESMSGDYNSDNMDEPNGNGEAKLGENTTEADVSGGGPARLRSRSLAESTRDADGDADKVSNKLMTDEMDEREIGKVDGEVYLEWARAAGGVWVLIPLLLIFSAGEVMTIFSNWWLTYWSDSASKEIESQLHFLSVYGLINMVAIAADFLRMSAVLVLGLRASKKLFNGLLESTLMAPMSFFDTTPSGRIMNRFSKDVYTLDESLPASFLTYIQCIFQVVSTLVVVTSVTPVFAVILVPILYYYRRQQAYFSQCYRELTRIDSVARSPIYSLFGETLDGSCTIRSFAAETPLLERMFGLVDRQQHAYYLTQAGHCWLAVRLELVGTLIVFSACMAAVLEKRSIPAGDEVFAGLAGLSISYALSVTQSLNWAVRVGSDFEANMVSVERIRQYCDLESEAPHESDKDEFLSLEWPEKGVIEFKEVKLRYRAGLPLVLKGLNLTIPGQSRVGIVGRTGAGKSTLVTALMRLVELYDGQIILDGVDTKSIGLRRLRSSIAVIPQDPVLFSGSIKSNLDPFEQFADERLVDVLVRVGLWTSESGSAIKSLEDQVLQEGGNFSAGQRQLLVIARALLDGASVVICDEATAAIDAEADLRIQRVLRTDFAEATTLTVAHRLNTIMDSTHILVMSDGKAVEFDTPGKLLSKGGLFKDLVDKWEEEHED